jgi:hypothetical protein
MTTSYDYDAYSSVDDELLLADDRGYTGGGGGGSDSFWALKSGSNLKVYFTTPGPWTKQLDHGWWNWREIFAQDGLTGVGQLPGGMKAFPVKDQVNYRDDEGNLRRRDIPASDPGYDQLLALVVPYANQRDEKKKKATRPVRDVVGVSIVELGTDGSLYPKILTMSANRYRKIYEQIQSFRAMNKDFSLVGFPWQISIQGEAAAEVVSFRPLPDEPPIDLPEPHDIPELLKAKREQVYAYVQAATGVDTSTYAQAEKAAPAEEVQQAEAVTDGEVAVDKSEVYASMTDTRLKTLLTKKGVSVAPKTPRDELLALAVANNV